MQSEKIIDLSKQKAKLFSEWIEYKLIKTGGWGYKVGIIKDPNGKLRLRIAKGKILPNGDIKQSFRVSFSSRDVVEIVAKLLNDYAAKL